MRWNVKKKVEPKHTESRSILRFAWLPVQIEDKWVWLETYVQNQYYSGIDKSWVNLGKEFFVPYY